MDQYVPPLVAVTTGIVVVGLCFVLRIPFFLVGLLSILMVIYVFQDHSFQFSHDYANPTVPNIFKDHAPIFMITIVIALAIGFLLFRFGPKAITTNASTNGMSQAPGFLDGIMRMFSPRKEPDQSQRSNFNEYGRSGTYDRV